MASYIPDPGAIALQRPNRFARALSQRDLALTIPVNFVTYPGISLQAACFAHDRYEDQAAAKCISNLIATGFQRLEVDVYWDASRRTWSLCPVELGGAGPIASSSTIAATGSGRTSTQLATRSLTNRDAAASPAPLQDRQLDGDALSLSGSPFTGSSTTNTAVSTATLNANPLTTSLASSVPAPTPIPADETLFKVGPYTCSPGTNLALLVSVMNQYMGSTETDLNATVIVLTLNVHASVEAANPLGSAQEPSENDLPTDGSLLSAVLTSNNTGSFLYSPESLLSERSNLNSSKSWFTVARDQQPDAGFFTTETQNGVVSSENGWPSESYFEMNFGKRFLAQYGDIDPQMRGYNFAGDEAFIFPQNYLEAPRLVTVANDGNVSTGCFFDPTNNALSAANSSWAINTIGNTTLLAGNTLDDIFAQARNLTYCGISPILNGTLNNVTADQDSTPYTAFVESTRWSWGSGQPVNASNTPSPNDYRCATLNSTSGFWQVSDCSQSYYGACRIDAKPYVWKISSSDSAYGKIDRACDDDSAFDVPRTALENTYLLSVWRAYQQHNDDDSGPLLWLNFNDLDEPSCWVIGQNTTCPYNEPPQTNTREVVVPVVAGVIVFVIALSTVLVKCAGNRQQSKRRRRRGNDGWDYEGVPS